MQTFTETQNGHRTLPMTAGAAAYNLDQVTKTYGGGTSVTALRAGHHGDRPG